MPLQAMPKLMKQFYNVVLHYPHSYAQVDTCLPRQSLHHVAALP